MNKDILELDLKELYSKHKDCLDRIDPYEKNSWVENKLIEFENSNGGHWDTKNAKKYFDNIKIKVNKLCQKN